MKEADAAPVLRKTGGKKTGFASSLSHDAYASGFRIFNGISSELGSMLAWGKRHLSRLLPAQECLSVLSVGAGTGYFDFEFIPLFAAKYRCVEYKVIEPNPAHRRQFESGAASEDFQNVRFEILPVRFEAYSAPARFDLIHFTHCLYYLPDREGAIARAMELISEEGPVLVFHQTPDGINQIQRNFLKPAKGCETEMFSSRDLRDILDRRGMAYRLEVVDSFLDLTNYGTFESEPGKDLLSFFLECDARQLKKKFVKEVAEFIRSISIFGKGRQLVYHPVAIFSR